MAERKEWIENNEDQMIDQMQQAVKTIQSMRKYPKEKDVVLSYLEKKID